MRKIVIVLILIVLAASAGAYFYIYQPFTKKAALEAEAVVPGDALAMVRMCELKEQIDRFRAGCMGQTLGGIDWPNLLAAMGMAENQRLTFIQALEDLKAGVDSVWFDVLFGRDISLVILNGEIDAARLEAGDMTPLLDALVVVSRPSQPTQVLESLSSMIGTQLSVDTEAYEKWEISRLPLEGGPPLYYTLTDGLMISGFSIEPVKTCLRQSLDEQTCLLNSDTYRKHCAGLYEAGRTDMIVFADVEKFRKVFLYAIDTMDAPDADVMKLRTQIENMEGLESLNLARYDDGGPLVNSRMIIGLDRANMSSNLSRILGRVPETNPTLEYAPADALLYSWQNTSDPMLYWENMQNDPSMTPEMLAEIRQSFAAKTGMALEDLLLAFGSQAGFLVNDINMEGMFPVPEVGLFAEVTEPEVIKALIGQMVGQSGMALQQETYGDTDIHYVTMPLGGNLSPAYAFSKGFITLAINRTLLKGMLDAADAGPLETHPNFEAFGSGMTSENNSVFYIRTEGLFEKVGEVITWGMSWTAMMQPDKAENMQDIVILGIEPLLDGLSMIKAVGGRAYAEEEKISSEFQMLLDRP